MRALLFDTVLLALLASMASGCGGDEEQARRELLRPVDVIKKREAEREQKRVVDASGELIPSDQKIAGITLPKGLQLYRSFEHEWYLEAKGISMAQLERYFAPRLDPLSVERNATHVTFADAHLREDPRARKVTVRLAGLIGNQTVTDVYIRQVRPPRLFKQEDEAKALLDAKRRRAD